MAALPVLKSLPEAELKSNCHGKKQKTSPQGKKPRDHIFKDMHEAETVGCRVMLYYFKAQ